MNALHVNVKFVFHSNWFLVGVLPGLPSLTSQAATKRPSAQLHKIMNHDGVDCTVSVRTALFALGVGPNRAHRALWLAIVHSFFIAIDMLQLSQRHMKCSLVVTLLCSAATCFMGYQTGELLVTGSNGISNISMMCATSSDTWSTTLKVSSSQALLDFDPLQCCSMVIGDDDQKIVTNGAASDSSESSGCCRMVQQDPEEQDRILSGWKRFVF